MGYYTLFSLSVIPEPPVDLDDTMQSICDLDTKTLESVSVKCYDWQDHMRDLSRNYPNHIFDLWGDGEDFDDKWHAVFVNGQMALSYAEIHYPPIDIASIDSIGDRCPEYFL